MHLPDFLFSAIQRGTGTGSALPIVVVAGGGGGAVVAAIPDNRFKSPRTASISASVNTQVVIVSATTASKVEMRFVVEWPDDAVLLLRKDDDELL